MGKKLKILLVDDDEEDYMITRDHLSDRSYLADGVEEIRFELDWVDSYDKALRAFEENRYDLFLIDYQLGDKDGLSLLRQAVQMGIEAPLILMTGQGSYQVDMEAMKAGAVDYRVKGEVTAPLLERSIRYAIERKRAEVEIRKTATEIARLYAAEAQRARELDALRTATAALLNTIDLETLLRQILDAAQSAIPAAEQGFLYLVTPETGQLQIRAITDFTDPRIKKFSVPQNNDYPARSVRERRPLLIEDTLADRARETGLDTQSSGQPVVRSALLAPLLLSGNVLGVLYLTSSQPHAFTDSDLRLLMSFATTTTAAIQNAMLHSEVQKMALTDGLTGIFNRRGFFDLGQREIERARRFNRPLSAILIDVDHLKQINDTYGHAAGDQVLKIVAERFRSSVREVDILGRYGGDEFAILLPEADLFMACAIAERIRDRLQDPLVIPAPFITHTNHTPTDITLTITASMGVANALKDTRDLGSLLGRADQALYVAKGNGRNRVEVG